MHISLFNRSKSGFLQRVGKSDGSGWSVCLGMAGDIKAGGQKNTAFWQGQQPSGRAQAVMLVQIGEKWKNPENYDLCLRTDVLGYQGCVDLICDYIRCEMIPTSVGGEQQISISSGSQSPI